MGAWLVGKKVKREIGALNVRVHPHTSEHYVDLIKAAYRLKQPIIIHGSRAGVIRSLNKPDRTGIITGTIMTYLSIDLDQPWFNDETFDVASEDDLEDISLPEHLHPDISSFYFALDPILHLIYFEKYGEGKTFSHRSALVFFDTLFQQDAIVDKFGPVKISIVQSKLALDHIFSLDRITKIDILIEKPNDIWPDDFEKHLEGKNARSVNVVYKADGPAGLIRDGQINKLTEASLENGKTEVSGYEETGFKKLSTESFPKIAQDKFNADMT